MSWLSVTAEVGAKNAESFSDALLAAGAISVDIHDPYAGTEKEEALFGEPGATDEKLWESAQVTALFPAGCEVKGAIADAAKEAGLVDLPAYTVSPVAEQDWVRLTQAQFDPIRISERLWITPSWHRFPDPSAINLVLDPGLAFGTGSHPTTRLCLVWLDAHLQGGEEVLDYGCGSGILAIAALKLGAAKAIGIDIDPQAVAASRENARQNEVKADFFLPDEASGIKADIVVANILANPLKLLAPLLADATRQGGRIVLSGILEKQEQEVSEIYSRWFEMEEPAREEGWVCLTGKRK